MTLIIADNTNKVLYADYVGLISGYDKIKHSTKIVEFSMSDIIPKIQSNNGFSGSGKTSPKFLNALDQLFSKETELSPFDISRTWLDVNDKEDSSGLGFIKDILIMLDSDGEYIQFDETTKFAAIGCGAPYALSLLEYMHEQTGKVDIAKVFQIANKLTSVGAEYEEVKI